MIFVKCCLCYNYFVGTNLRVRPFPIAAQFIFGVPQACDDTDQGGWFKRSNLPPPAFRATQMVLSKNEIK
jgi:hypothetical protein